MIHSEMELRELSYQYRRRFIEIFSKIGFGHLTSAYSWTEIATILYHEMLGQVGRSNDHLFISKGHGIGILFPIFENLGFFTKDELEAMIRIGGSNREIRRLVQPGFDFYGGSLGIGIGMAAGYAKGLKLSRKDEIVYCICGDAECYEGSVWEAANFAGFQGLDNLIVIVDRNGMGVTDYTEHMLALEPMRAKWEAFNWETQMIDGHCFVQIYESINTALKSKSGKPQCIIAKTIKGNGLDFVIGNPHMHGYVPMGEDINRAFKELKK